MLITKEIQLEFADTRIRAIDCIQDIRKAAENAGLNLFSRYNVRLQYPMPTEDERVVVEIQIPVEIADTFAVGNHLRGISSFLLSNFGKRYQQYLVGKRLLNYIEIQKPKQKAVSLSPIDRLEALISFARLLERSDEEASGQITQILTILKESQ